MATSLVRFFLQIFAILPIYAARVLLVFRKGSRSSWHFGRIGIGSRQLLKWPAGEQNDVRESAMLSQPCLLRILQRPNVVEGRSRLHISGTRGELLVGGLQGLICISCAEGMIGCRRTQIEPSGITEGWGVTSHRI